MVTSHKLAFNLEKESKIINPHKMDMRTTSENTFKGLKGFSTMKTERRIVEAKKPSAMMTSYSASFPNW